MNSKRSTYSLDLYSPSENRWKTSAKTLGLISKIGTPDIIYYKKDLISIAAHTSNSSTIYIFRPGLNTLSIKDLPPVYDEYCEQNKYLIISTLAFERSGSPRYKQYIYSLAHQDHFAVTGWLACTFNGSLIVLRENHSAYLVNIKTGAEVFSKYLTLKFGKLLRQRDRFCNFERAGLLETKAVSPFDPFVQQRNCYINSSLNCVYQMGADGWKQANGDHESDGLVDGQVIDKVITQSRGVIWKFKRRKYALFRGFHFTGSGNAFSFLATEPFRMGKEKLHSFGPGIYSVDCAKGLSKHIDLPKSAYDQVATISSD